MKRATILIVDGVDQTYLDLDDLLYAKAHRNYTYIHQTNGKMSIHIIPISKLMEKIEAVCSYNASHLMRIGRSHIINTKYLYSIELKKKCITLRCHDNATELRCSRQSLNELSRVMHHRKTADVLQHSKNNYTINAGSYDDLCDKILLIDGVECTDLGLPSGVKWANENLEAPLGGISEMFAWGETAPKRVSTNDNYRFGLEKALTKYTKADGYNQLLSEDDAATCILGDKWRTPTKEDFQELIDKCQWQWSTWGIYHGCLVTGPNGNSIFLHAGGYNSESMGINSESQGNYWTSSLYENEESLAYRCSFCDGLVENEDVSFFDEVAERFLAFYIRPVTD